LVGDADERLVMHDENPFCVDVEGQKRRCGRMTQTAIKEK
jgi:hypothetical protein